MLARFRNKVLAVRLGILRLARRYVTLCVPTSRYYFLFTDDLSFIGVGREEGWGCCCPSSIRTRGHVGWWTSPPPLCCRFHATGGTPRTTSSSANVTPMRDSRSNIFQHMATPLALTPSLDAGNEDEELQAFFDSVEVALSEPDVDSQLSVSLPHQSMLL